MLRRAGPKPDLHGPTSVSSLRSCFQCSWLHVHRSWFKTGQQETLCARVQLLFLLVSQWSFKERWVQIRRHFESVWSQHWPSISCGPLPSSYGEGGMERSGNAVQRAGERSRKEWKKVGDGGH